VQFRPDRSPRRVTVAVRLVHPEPDANIQWR
jgi:hypothetical protein